MAKVYAEGVGDNGAAHGLRTRRREREALLNRIGALLEADKRIAAAWAFGSAGNGDADDLSDLDVRVAVFDEHIATIRERRQEYAARFGNALLFAEAPQNAPKGGAFLLALYEGEYGPQEVDWSWLPASTAQTWPRVRILFDRAGLPQLSEPPIFEYQPIPESTPLEAVERSACNFWGMMMVLGKYLARSPHEERMGLLWLLTNHLREAQAYLGRDLSPKFEEMADHPHPSEKIAILRDLAVQMASLMPALADVGAHVPETIVPSMARYLDLIEAVALHTTPV
jgi:hypothetical protein